MHVLFSLSAVQSFLRWFEYLSSGKQTSLAVLAGENIVHAKEKWDARALDANVDSEIFQLLIASSVYPVLGHYL